MPLTVPYVLIPGGGFHGSERTVVSFKGTVILASLFMPVSAFLCRSIIPSQAVCSINCTNTIYDIGIEKGVKFCYNVTWIYEENMNNQALSPQ